MGKILYNHGFQFVPNYICSWNLLLPIVALSCTKDKCETQKLFICGNRCNACDLCPNSVINALEVKNGTQTENFEKTLVWLFMEKAKIVFNLKWYFCFIFWYFAYSMIKRKGLGEDIIWFWWLKGQHNYRKLR